ncbi:MAG: hypothetical protein HZB39_19490 [Planctomycetes bacterium]|nr:hypothetical protein [Planctomycetota bacterium]
MNPIRSVLSCLLVPCAALVAQTPELRATPYVLRGDAVDFVLFAPPGAASLLLFDVTGGPALLYRETWYLGLTPLLGVLDAGVVGSGGFRTSRITNTATAPIGVPLYFQGVAIDWTRAFPLQATDGESCVVGASRTALVEDYLDPVAMGLTGSFDRSVRGRVQASPARTRTHDAPPVGGLYYWLPLLGPLNRDGVRTQSVYRTADLGSTGEPELLVAIRWHPERPVTPDVLHNVAIDLSHSHVVPDYRIDPLTAWPRFPASGLATTFAQNVLAGEAPQRAFQGDYTIDLAAIRADGYVPFPAIRPFAWNGIDSLLLDIRTPPDPNASGTNGLRAYLMTPTVPMPNARVLSYGLGGTPIDPYRVTTAQLGDSVYYDLQFEFLRVESVAISRWMQASIGQPDWLAPYVSKSQPAGSGITFEFRGARDAIGQTATAWSQNVDVADGLPFLQYRIRFTVVPGAATLPSVDQLVIPYQ